MSQNLEGRLAAEKAASIVCDAGGRLVGRTRFQKTAFLLELAGVGGGFSFEYRHYGPYSEELANAIRYANLHDLIDEEEKPASWGGFYSVFTTQEASDDMESTARKELIAISTEADPIELELAATAAFLSLSGESDPWAETATRKSGKAKDGRLESAKSLYKQLASIATPRALPEID